MNIISLPKLRELRYPHSTMAKLQREAREGLLPGVFKKSLASAWEVDLDEHDAGIAAAKAASAPEATRENKLFRMVMDLMRRPVP